MDDLKFDTIKYLSDSNYLLWNKGCHSFPLTMESMKAAMDSIPEPKHPPEYLNVLLNLAKNKLYKSMEQHDYQKPLLGEDSDRPTLSARLERCEEQRNDLRAELRMSEDRVMEYKQRLFCAEGDLEEARRNAVIMGMGLVKFEQCQADIEKCRRYLGTAKFEEIIGGKPALQKVREHFK